MTKNAGFTPTRPNRSVPVVSGVVDYAVAVGTVDPRCVVIAGHFLGALEDFAPFPGRPAPRWPGTGAERGNHRVEGNVAGLKPFH